MSYQLLISRETQYPVADRSLHNVVYTAIVEAIHRGEMRPGDRITESDIAQRLGISRSPVREAFARLAADNVIVRLPRRGNFIARLEQSDIESIQDARRLIEGHAARLAAQRLTETDQVRLAEIIDLLVAAARESNWIKTVSLNALFHATVLEIAGNPILTKMWSSVDPLTWLVAATVPAGHRHDPEDLERRHKKLLNELSSGNPDRAEQAFRAHVGGSDITRQEGSNKADSSHPAISLQDAAEAQK